MIASTSVVTHTFNQNKNIEHLIKGLIKSKFSDELIIVAMGEEDPQDVLGEALPFSTKVFYLQRPCTSLPLAQAKNIGFTMAQGEAVVFIDPNHIPTPELFKSVEELLTMSPRLIVTGECNELIKRPRKNWSYSSLKDNSQKVKMNTGVKTLTNGNFAMLKSLYIEMEGFEERFLGNSAEIDFFMQTEAKGIKTAVSKETWTYLIKERSKHQNMDLDKLIESSALFYSKWGCFPSVESLKALKRKGLIHLNEYSGTLERM
ncbi:MAG: hypothetical protein CME64_16795 [Halobacteriovoraceae bacterium]|nr:hypothetical protein [Halobacteriovoraceae bacterium]